MTGSRRVLVLAPFPPRLDAPHGGGQAVARIVLALARRNTIALLVLRGPGEQPTDVSVSAACDLVCEVDRRPVGVSLRTAWTERRRLLTLLRGRPLWVASVETREFRSRLDEIIATWHPNVVQVEFGVLGGFLDRLQRGGGIWPRPRGAPGRSWSSPNATRARFERSTRTWTSRSSHCRGAVRPL